MAKMTSEADLGDIIRSEKFAYGTWGSLWKIIGGEPELQAKIVDVDGRTTQYPVSHRKPGTAWDAPAVYESVDEAAYDPSRGRALFVVEYANMEGGGTGMGLHDIYPDGWHVRARRLGEAGEYDPAGELIRFYQSGCFTTNIGEVELAGRMKMIFTRSDGGK